MKEINLAQSKPRFRMVLVLGPEKTGKTRFIATAPKPIYLFSFDDGWDSIAGIDGIKAGVYTKDDRHKGIGIYSEFMPRLRMISKEKYTWLDGRTEAYKTIAIDPISFLGQGIVDEVQATNFPNQPDAPLQIQHWAPVLDKFLDLLNLCRNAAENVIVTCHVMLRESEVSGSDMFLPMLPGQTRDKIGASFDAVGFMHVVPKGLNKVEHYISFLPTPTKRLGIRIPANLDGIFTSTEIPNFITIQDKFNQQADNTASQAASPVVVTTKQ